MALLTESDLIDLRAILIDGLSIDGVGVGGATWIPEVPTGNGVTATVTIADGTAITGYAYQGKIAAPAQTAPGAPVSFAPWFFVLVSGTITVGSVIRSQSDSSYRFLLLGKTADPLYTTYNAERVAK